VKKVRASLLRRALRAVASGGAGVLVAALGAVLCLDVPAVRREVLAQVNARVFDKLFQGKLAIQSIGHLDAFGIADVDVRLDDSSGRPLLLAEGVSARIATLTLLRTLAFGHGDLVLDLGKVSIRNLDVRIDGDDDGVAIARAFLPRTPSTTPSRVPDGRGVHLYAPHIRIEHAWGHGQLGRIPYVDADLRGLDAAFSLSPRLVTIDARKAQVHARGIALGADVEGAATGHLEVALGDLPASVGRVSGRTAWDGTVGTLAETASLAIEHGRFDAAVDVREATPESIRSLWPASPISASAGLHVEAHGPLDAIAVDAHAALDAATVDLHGGLQWGAAKGAKLHLDVTGVDLHQLVAAAPASSVGLRGDVSATLAPDGRLDGEADLEVPAGHVGPHGVPRTTLKTKGFRAPSGAFGGDAAIAIEEPGVPTTIELHAVPRGQSSSVDFSIQSHAVKLGAVHRFSTDATGSAHVAGKGNVDLDRLAVDVSLDSRGQTFSRGALRVGSIAVTGQVHGRLENPDVDLSLKTRGLAWGGTSLTELDVGVRGHALTPHVTVHARSLDVPDVDAAVDVDVMSGPTFKNADLTLVRRGVTAHLQAARTRVEHGDVSVEDVSIEGLGDTLRGSFRKEGESLHVSAKASRLDVARVARLLAVDEIVREGDLAVDAAISVSGGAANGQAHVRLANGAVGSLGGISFALDGTMAGRRLDATLGFVAGDVGSGTVEARDLVAAGRSPLLATRWQSVSGDVGLDGRVDLARLGALLPPDALPASALRGVLTLKGHLERDSASDFTPLVELEASTAGFAAVGPVADGADGPPRPAPWHFEGVDASLTARINGQRGALDLGVRVRDAKGDLASFEGRSSVVPYRAFFASPRSALELLPDVAFDATLRVPPRPLASWPPALGPVPLEGELGADVAIRGTVRAPHVTATARLRQGGASAARLSDPVDLSLEGAYDGSRLDLALHGDQESRRVLDAEGVVTVSARDLLAATADLPWKASAKVHVEAFPLVTIGALDDRQVRGALSGDVKVDDLHADARAQGKLTVRSLKVGDAVYPTAVATFGADGKTVDAEVRLDQADGFGSVKATVAAAWGASLAPVPDPKRSLGVEVQAKHFRAAALLPFVRGGVDELDGVLDASVKATVDPVSREVHAQGAASIEDGVFRLPSFGGELHDISAKVTLAPDGLLTVDKLIAFGVSGELLASASARLDGLRLVAAKAAVRIPKSQPLPLSVGGSPIGMVDGRVDITETTSTDRRSLEIGADIPTFHLVVPEAGAQDVQSLGPIPGVVVGHHLAPGTFVADAHDPDEDRGEEVVSRAADAVQIHVTTHFGDDVLLRRGADLRIGLTGGPSVTVTDKAHVSGQVQLRNGVLNLYGKTFEIDHGTVTFVGDDASNPQVSVTAGWTAPEGTQVYADFIGPLRTGKVVLRSEPALPNNEIVQLLLFGTTDGQSAAGQPPSGTTSALGAAGSQAAQPLNRALDQFGLSAVSAKLDSTSAAAKPEVEIQVARDISVQLAHILFIGPPPPGSSPDTTLLTIDWRFLRKWSLAATVGNAGSSVVDLLWQYRY
jgi:translocation and assembly module TamB